MESLPGIVQMIGILTNFALLGTTRVTTCMRWLAVQGVLIGSLPVFLIGLHLPIDIWLLVVGNVTLKGIVFPLMLIRLHGRTGYKSEVEPFIGFVGSVIFGVAALALASWLAGRINTAMAGHAFSVLDAAIFLILNGLFLMISRRKAVMQVLGYLVLENGIFVFGLSAVTHTPLLVELGVLLDAFVAVFVMGIAVFRINREFSDIAVDQMDALKG